MLSDSPRLAFTLKAIDMGYQSLNKRRIALEQKKTKAQLSAHHKVKQGTLLKVLQDLDARQDISIDKYQSDWLKIPAGAMLMYIDVEHDHNFDAVTLKVLWEQKIYFIHKNSNFKDFNNNFNDKFEVLL